MPTDDQLRAIMPALQAAKRQSLLPFLQQAIDEFDIASPTRQAAFLAQLAHESGQFRFMEELWGPTDAQRRYEPVSTLASRLGNTEAGDGKRFKGRGPIQLTGRANYQRFGSALGVDLLADPPRAATPEVAFRIAGLFWQRNGLNELADLATADAFRRITRKINGGENGLADRERFYASACQVFDVTAAAPPVEIVAPEAGPAMASRDVSSFDRGFESIFELEPAAAVSGVARRRKKPAAKRVTRRAPARKAAKKAVAKTAKKASPKKAKKAAAKKAKKAAAKKMTKAAKKAAPRRRLAKKR